MAYDPDLAERVRDALGEPGTRLFDMGRGPSAAMVVVAADGVATDQALASWVERGLAFATTLPAK